jgi:hypothetical protein
MYGCPVIKKPFTSHGIFRPMRLPCSCVVSEAAAQCSVQKKHCQLCYKPISKWTTLVEDAACVRAIEAQHLSVSVRMFPKERVILGDIVDTDCDPPFHAATLVLQDFEAGDLPVNVSVKVLQACILPHERAQIQCALTTSFLASESPHVLKLYGGCWRGEELWCAFSCFLRSVLCKS